MNSVLQYKNPAGMDELFPLLVLKKSICYIFIIWGAKYIYIRNIDTWDIKISP